jgi:hypothetical protein
MEGRGLSHIRICADLIRYERSCPAGRKRMLREGDVVCTSENCVAMIRALLCVSSSFGRKETLKPSLCFDKRLSTVRKSFSQGAWNAEDFTRDDRDSDCSHAGL